MFLLYCRIQIIIKRIVHQEAHNSLYMYPPPPWTRILYINYIHWAVFRPSYLYFTVCNTTNSEFVRTWQIFSRRIQMQSINHYHLGESPSPPGVTISRFQWNAKAMWICSLTFSWPNLLASTSGVNPQRSVEAAWILQSSTRNYYKTQYILCISLSAYLYML